MGHEAIPFYHGSQLSRSSQGPYSLSLKKTDVERFAIVAIRNFFNCSQPFLANKILAFKIIEKNAHFQPIKSTNFQQFATLSVRNISSSQDFLKHFPTFHIFLRIPILRVAVRKFTWLRFYSWIIKKSWILLKVAGTNALGPSVPNTKIF